MTAPSSEEVQGELKGARDTLDEAEQARAAGLSRLAVSGAYYAIYHAARAALWTEGIDAKTHRGLATQFSRTFVLTGRLDQEYAKILNRGREKREKANYDPVTFMEEAVDVQKAVTDARVFVEKIAELLQL